MYPITTMYPEDPRQPFYNPRNATMTPLARLYIRKVKTIPQNCDAELLQALVLDVSDNADDEGANKREYNAWELLRTNRIVILNEIG